MIWHSLPFYPLPDLTLPLASLLLCQQQQKEGLEVVMKLQVTQAGRGEGRGGGSSGSGGIRGWMRDGTTVTHKRA